MLLQLRATKAAMDSDLTVSLKHARERPRSISDHLWLFLTDGRPPRETDSTASARDIVAGESVTRHEDTDQARRDSWIRVGMNSCCCDRFRKSRTTQFKRSFVEDATAHSIPYIGRRLHQHRRLGNNQA